LHIAVNPIVAPFVRVALYGGGEQQKKIGGGGGESSALVRLTDVFHSLTHIPQLWAEILSTLSPLF
jgi:hypothetical protein